MTMPPDVPEKEGVPPIVWPPPIYHADDGGQPYAFVLPIDVHEDGEVLEIDCVGLRRTSRFPWVVLPTFVLSAMLVGELRLAAAWFALPAVIAIAAVILVDPPSLRIPGRAYLYRFDRSAGTMTAGSETVPFAKCVIQAERARGRHRVAIYGPFRDPERARQIGDFHTAEIAGAACAYITRFMVGGIAQGAAD